MLSATPMAPSRATQVRAEDARRTAIDTDAEMDPREVVGPTERRA